MRKHGMYAVSTWPGRFGRTASRVLVPFAMAILANAVMVAPAQAVQIGDNTIVVPVVVHGDGYLGTKWRTNVWIDHPYGDASSVTVTYYPETGGKLEKTMNIDAYKGLFFHDIVLETFGLDDSKGMLIVSAPSTRVEVRARVYNTGSAYGEFGQAVPGLPLARLGRQGYLSGVTTAGDNRLAIGIANPTGEAFTVVVNIHDGITNEYLTTKTIDLGPHQVVQLNKLAEHWNLPARESLSVDINSGDNAHAFYAYASVVRNDNGDATFIFGTTPNVGLQ
ncbi:MAG: hypothetical protein GXP48_11165 [Acidobacteria bacterium]|nr:hypothetical protein [Acidobacteriota bacterium]